MTSTCRLCGGEARPQFRGVLLGGLSVEYWKCGVCDYLQTDPPTWLSEAYDRALSDLDTGSLERNASHARMTVAVLRIAGILPQEICLDVGGGHGVFVRMMRDFGYDFRWSDRYAENLFARGFEGDLSEGPAVLTALELFEHFAEPREEIERLFAARPDLMLVSTLLHTDSGPDWWYLVPETGQHVGFFSHRTMTYLAERHGYRAICRPGGACTLFISSSMNLSWVKRKWLGEVLRGSRWSRMCAWRRFPSRSQTDHEDLRRRRGARHDKSPET